MADVPADVLADIPGRDNYISRPLDLGRHPPEWNPSDPARVVGHLMWNGAGSLAATRSRVFPGRTCGSDASFDRVLRSWIEFLGS